MTQQFGKDVSMDGVLSRGEHLFAGILAGVIAAAIGAGIWMGITVATDMHIGFVAIGIGALVGFAVRIFGNGRSMIFGLVGALLTLAGCLGGEILTVAHALSTPETDFFATLMHLNLVDTVTTIFRRADVITYVIYGIGVFEGYKLSIRS
jgi:hypothetical protein